jgi:hypothetical protein
MENKGGERNSSFSSSFEDPTLEQYYDALGEKFRDRAKSENWSEGKSKIALAILQGAVPNVKSYSSSRIDSHHGPVSVSRQYIAIGRFSLNEFSPDVEKFAIQFFIEMNPAIAAALPPLDFENLNDQALIEYTEKIQKEKRTQEESASRLAWEELQKKAKDAGARCGYKFIGTGDNANGARTFGFLINQGTRGWRVAKTLKDSSMLSGSLSTGWSIWVEEKDLDNLKKFFVSSDANQPSKSTNTDSSQNRAAAIETPKDSGGSTHNPFEDALKNWGKK